MAAPMEAHPTLFDAASPSKKPKGSVSHHLDLYERSKGVNFETSSEVCVANIKNKIILVLVFLL
jgi:hypothetical protein